MSYKMKCCLHRSLQSKVANAKSVIQEQGKMTPILDQSLSNTQTMFELDCLVSSRSYVM